MMEQKIIQVVLGILVALMTWNFKTLNDMQLQMETVMYKYANQADIAEMRLSIKELEWRLQADASSK
jgi:hypothetical protein